MIESLGFPDLTPFGKKIAVVSDLHMGDTRKKDDQPEASLLDTWIHHDRRSEEWQTNEKLKLPYFIQLLQQAQAEVAPRGESFDFLILLGDIFETSLATTRETVANVQAFLQEVARSGAVKQFLYIPGNHDHHFWGLINEESLLTNRIRSYGGTKPAYDIFEHHFHKQTDLLYRSTFLDGLLAGINNPPPIFIASPNAVCKYDNHTYIFHHGHLLSEAFTVISTLLEGIKPIENLEVIEAANSGWTELGWYHLGQTSKFGEIIEQVYNNLNTNPDKAIEDIDRVFDHLWKNNIEDAIPWWVKGIDFLVFFTSLKKIVRGGILKAIKDRDKEHSASDERDTPITLHADIIKEYIQTLARIPDYGIQPGKTRFVFGHTHRYGQFTNAVMNDFPKVDYDFEAYNTGTWKDDRAVDNRILTISDTGDFVAYPNYEAHVELFKDPDFENNDGSPVLVLHIKNGGYERLPEEYDNKISSLRLHAPEGVTLHLYPEMGFKEKFKKWKIFGKRIKKQEIEGTGQPVEKNKIGLDKMNDKISSIGWSVS